jgi:hypothetical protein
MERPRPLESAVVNANDAVLITEAEPIDLPGPRIVHCHAALPKTTGHTEAEILGRTPRLLHSTDTDLDAAKNDGDRGNRVTLGHAPDLDIVAEGVEEVHPHALQAKGCHLVQGCHLGRPLSVSDVDGVLARHSAETTRRGGSCLRSP